eukprot:GHVR01093356.1.p1 GENE.GHVR01093356.1~~GHVR01093356.1.p1  ORF type:complete len:130 (+),score=12.81 GHVR01093356.1:334-723(+)
MLLRKALDVIDVNKIPYYPCFVRQALAQLVGVVQMIMFVLIFFGQRALSILGLPSLSFVTMIGENKLMSFLCVVFVGSMLSNGFLTTHAFEIFLGKDLVFSGVETGRLPSMPDLMRAFEAHGLDIQSPY